MDTERLRRIRDLNRIVMRFRGISQDENTAVAAANIQVYFSDLERHLADHVRAAHSVVGCVAWLTHSRLLYELGRIPGGVSIIVQKEDFLRPDTDAGPNWRSMLHKRYANLKSLPSWLGSLDIVSVAANGDRYIEPIRCVGIHNRCNLPAVPRMHHKFLVFCDSHSGPYAVWTGSFNLTQNAGYSLENAVVITDPTVAVAYFEEWIDVAWISEPLDWDTDWVRPEWSCT